MVTNNTTNARGNEMKTTWTNLGNRMYFDGTWYITKDGNRWIGLDGKGREISADTRREIENLIKSL